MLDSISEQLNEACRAAVMDDDLHIEYINISIEAYHQLILTDTSYLSFDKQTASSPITWHGVELKECHELPGIAFNLVTSPAEIPAWGGSPKDDLPG